ncbi:MAG: hypothetical protein ACOC4J_00420 [Bacteroidota bacterium]
MNIKVDELLDIRESLCEIEAIDSLPQVINDAFKIDRTEDYIFKNINSSNRKRRNKARELYHKLLVKQYLLALVDVKNDVCLEKI